MSAPISAHDFLLLFFCDLHPDFALVGALFVFTAGPDMVNDMMHVDKVRQ